MKIYTRTGDDGTTALIGGRRVSKSDPRIDCCGDVDELNAALGLAAVAADGSLRSSLLAIQSELFIIGAHLAVADNSGAEAGLPSLDESAIIRIEQEIDAAEQQLPPLRCFILPGGSESAARLHLARTICRRAERRIVAFAHDRPIEKLILTYLNRLSDWLFVHSRLANHRAQIPDLPWHPNR